MPFSISFSICIKYYTIMILPFLIKDIKELITDVRLNIETTVANI